MVFTFTPKIGEDGPILTSIFFRWVVQPPISYFFRCFERLAFKDTFKPDLPPNCRSGCSHYHCRSAEVPKGPKGWSVEMWLAT